MSPSIPKHSKLITNIERDTDQRGQILSIVDHPVQNVALIESSAGSIRSNHYHYKDFHFMYVLDGTIDYFFKPIDSDDITYFKVESGQTIFTPPMEVHSCHFPVSTLLIVSSGYPRDQDTYEADTVRVNFINPDNIDEMISKYAK